MVKILSNYHLKNLSYSISTHRHAILKIGTVLRMRSKFRVLWNSRTVSKKVFYMEIVQLWISFQSIRFSLINIDRSIKPIVTVNTITLHMKHGSFHPRKTICIFCFANRSVQLYHSIETSFKCLLIFLMNCDVTENEKEAKFANFSCCKIFRKGKSNQ